MVILSRLLLGLIVAFLHFARAEKCKVSTESQHFVAGQPFALSYTLREGKYSHENVTCYKNSSITPITLDRNSRVHQYLNQILFFPLTLEDSGIYQFVIRDLGSCQNIFVNLTVQNRSSGWCGDSSKDLAGLADYHSQQTLYMGTTSILACHIIAFPNNTLSPIQWYKECKPIGDKENYFSVRYDLFIKNTSAENAGTYLCRTKLTYMGKHYDILNRISTTLLNNVERRKEPEIIYPRNNSIEVQLGSSLIIDCNIKDGKENLNSRSWKVNDTLVDFLNSNRIKEGIESNVSCGEKYIFYTVNISFSEVRQEDYGRPFICISGSSAAFIMLKHPAPDVRGYLIGGPIVLLCVIMVVTRTYHIVKVDIVLWYRSTFYSTLNQEDGKLYDAYVLYPKPKSESQSQDMNILVLRILPEVLERQCGYRLFIFGRDDLPGQAVANVIDENIKLSRRLIIILVTESSSYSLLKNMSEEQITIYNALIQDGMKVILIELEKIQDYTDMPESIKYLKQKHGVLRWRGNYTEGLQSAKTKFWKNVRYHMPPKRYPSSLEQLMKSAPCNYSMS
ncbi:interleukin-1 receptor-like 2 isoform X1 [Sarcophilus harrisii]|uniref:Interleukin 1 receptor like 2 n=1 Tax=Sarcophilus harrisii TaxID=9305 RepID=A0A7N4PRK2_SARHA|nr:interleukin-1 receptor-like 2 isoform X1 [Sarcophilus harrisii]XP_023357020.1 interleukin-1 receptor-like 2 isoform X1 [Sarcophilus harrisii]XP_023357021.1 interleukin-1 receptor-like 2 isoform X1 [Sarcophilus harrisii]XP_031814670.1 interleukin-1 receptor-like 2 isoform X1 [Sarcophilus harrisii]